MAATLVTVRILLQSLGAERYGVWMTISGTASYLIYADLGLGNGLQTAVARADGRSDLIAARKAVANTAAMLTAIAMVFTVGFLALYPVVPWQRVFNVSTPEAASVAGPATAVFILLTLLALPLNVILRIHIGYQQGFVNSAWTSGGQAIALVAIWYAANASPYLPLLVALLVGGPLLAQIVSGVRLFGWERPWLRPQEGDITRDECLTLARAGGQYFVGQAVSVAVLFADTIVIAQVFGASAVPAFAIPARLFGLASMVIVMAVSPFWPAYAEATARGDYKWAARALRRSVTASLLVATGLSASLAFAAPTIVTWWVGKEWMPNASLLASLAAQTIVYSVAMTLGTFLNGVGALRIQMVAAVAFAAIGIPLKIVFAKSFGVAGAPLSTAAAQLVLWVIPLALHVRAYLAEQSPRPADENAIL
ncbi:MAG: hypothetical protein WCC48_06375 [Anaeromyxobacteraceae bacterium]